MDKHKELKYWINEVNRGLADIKRAELRVGKALCTLRGREQQEKPNEAKE